MIGVALFLYRWIGWLLALVGIPYLVLFRRTEVRERLGGGGTRAKPGVIWIHAASLGEIEAALPIVRAWGDEQGAHRLLVSCTNRTARDRLTERLPEGARARLAPLDLWPLLDGLIDREKPSCFVFVETEIWPGWLAAAADRSIPTAVVNARISRRSLPRYRLLRPLLEPFLRRLRIIGCRTEEDRKRWIEIGAPAERCEVWGNTKYRLGPSPDSSARPAGARGRGGEGARFVLVAGSVRRGEEAILDLPRRVGGGEIRLVVAVRHLATLPHWEQACLSRELSFRRLGTTGLDPDGPVRRLREALRCPGPDLPPVLLVDRMGVLERLYRVADAAFVGGTWVPMGGHNLFEPSREGIPVLFGESIEGVRDAAEKLLETGGGSLVADLDRLAAAIRHFRGDPAAHARAGAAARRAAEELAGGVGRALDGLRRHGFPTGGRPG